MYYLVRHYLDIAAGAFGWNSLFRAVEVRVLLGRHTSARVPATGLSIGANIG